MPITIHGAALAFQALSYATGSTFGFLRYIIAIPLATCLAMLAVPDGVILPTKRPGRNAPEPLVDPAESFRGPHSRSVHVAVALVFAVLAAAEQPKSYVIASDQDFTAKLNDLIDGEITYLLSVPPTGRGASDALNLRYPTLYDTGADIATLEVEIPNNGDGQPDWRLYRVNAATPPG